MDFDMKRIIKILVIILIVLIISISILTKLTFDMQVNSVPISSEYEKIFIWGNNIAGNSSKSKLEDMNINYHENNLLISTVKYTLSIINDEYEDEEQTIDTLTYLYEIKSGYEKETYEDEPYIVPFIVKDSNQAVIIVPGGGYGYKSIDRETNEGVDIAKTLNQNGISAFVLHYRSNPYEYPIPQLDLQRAIRYVKYHSKKYGMEKLSLIGFSAGGNQIGTFINIIQGKDVFPEGYIKDDIDEVDDYIDSVAMIYPVLSYRYNVPMLFCLFDDEEVRNQQKREELLNMTDLSENFDAKDVKQFIAYGTKDFIVGMKETKKYINTALNNGANVRVIEAKNQPHAMKQKYYINEYIKWIKEN